MSNARLYIGRLSHRATERDVEYFFKGYGHIRDIILKDGFGFVEFDDPRDADDAVYDLNGKDLAGERVILEPTKRPGFRGYPSGGGGGGFGGGFGSRGPPPRGAPPHWLEKYGAPDQTRYRMTIENLSTKYSWQDLKDVFRDHGVEGMGYADAHRVRRNEAIVCFVSHSDLRRAMDIMDGRELNGRKIKCIDDTRDGSGSRSPRSRSPRSRSGSRSRSASPAGSRSRSPTPRSDRSRS